MPLDSKLRVHNNATTSVGQLVTEGLIPESDAQSIATVMEKFAVRVTPEMMDLIHIDDPDDPIRKQFIPSVLELVETPAELSDPIGDSDKEVSPSLVHRYRDRVLMKVVDACAVYCRFCFRRDMLGNGAGAISDDTINRAVAYISEHREVWEVILSGGDPLILSSARLRRLLQRIEEISHVMTIRIHTRVPVVDPSRVTDDLVSALTCSKPVWIVVHCNHPREVNATSREAFSRLVNAGIPLLCQTALLRGINDNAEILEELFRSLICARVKPYYLHHGDLAKGTKQFRTSITAGQEMVRRLRGRLSGICQPTYVLDTPGAYEKVPLEGSWIKEVGVGKWLVTDSRGGTHEYEEDVSPY